VHDVAEDPLASPHKPCRKGQGEGGLLGGERVCSWVAQGRPWETPLGLGLLSQVLVPLVLEGLEALLVIAPHHLLDLAGGVGDDPGNLLGGNLLGTQAQLALGQMTVYS
jgi:hypothetical protein